MRRRPRLFVRWILGLVALAAVVGFGGPYVFIHFVEGEAPAALAVTTSTPVQPATGAVEGNWQVTEGSEAGYRVDEVLNGQSNTAVGRTAAITGGLTATPTQVTEAKFTVDLTQVASDQARRDAQFQDRIMQTSQFPTAAFTLVDPVKLGELATAAGTRTVDVHGTLTLHGTTKDVTVPLTVVRSGAT